jgi:transposase
VRLVNEKDLEVLRQAALLLEAENRRLTQKVVELTRQLLEAKGESRILLQLKLEELERDLAKKNHMLFGRSTERRPVSPPAAKESAPHPGHGPNEQKELRIVEQIFKLDEPDRRCTKCGGILTEMKGQYEEAEEITVVEREFVKRKILRQKYRCSCNACIETALGPPKLFDGARYSVDFAIEVAADKYIDHNPLERQARRMDREGLEVTSQTLWDYLDALARRLSGAHDALHAHVLSHAVVGADETPWWLLGVKNRPTEKWQAWAVAAPNAVCYRLMDSRSAEAARELLRDFRGVVMVDDYVAYKSLAKKNGLTLANCWAHVRRKWIDLDEKNPEESKQAIDLIRELYQVEASCPTGPPGDNLRRELRGQRSKVIVDQIYEFLVAKRQRALPESGLHKAVEYTLGCWGGLNIFLRNPQVPLDNNATERAMRGVVSPVSLCASQSSARNPERPIVRRISTRTTSALSAA